MSKLNILRTLAVHQQLNHYCNTTSITIILLSSFTTSVFEYDVTG